MEQYIPLNIAEALFSHSLICSLSVPYLPWCFVWILYSSHNFCTVWFTILHFPITFYSRCCFMLGSPLIGINLLCTHWYWRNKFNQSINQSEPKQSTNLNFSSINRRKYHKKESYQNNTVLNNVQKVYITAWETNNNPT